jgi:putative acetyltransferase
LSKIQLVIPTTTEDMVATSDIFREYAVSLGFDLCFQDFEGEIANLPGDYAPPRGALLLAKVDGAIAGCCALRQLVEAILDAARIAGYDSVLLDTLNDMEIARTMYEELGFKEIPPYYHNPLAGAYYLKVDL